MISFVIAFLVLVGMRMLPTPRTKSQAALAITIVLAALSVMMGYLFIRIGWIDWSFWAAVISSWIWFMIMLIISKPGEPFPDPFVKIRRIRS